MVPAGLVMAQTADLMNLPGTSQASSPNREHSHSLCVCVSPFWRWKEIGRTYSEYYGYIYLDCAGLRISNTHVVLCRRSNVTIKAAINFLPPLRSSTDCRAQEDFIHEIGYVLATVMHDIPKAPPTSTLILTTIVRVPRTIIWTGWVSRTVMHYSPTPSRQAIWGCVLQSNNRSWGSKWESLHKSNGQWFFCSSHWSVCSSNPGLQE